MTASAVVSSVVFGAVFAAGLMPSAGPCFVNPGAPPTYLSVWRCQV
jgi:hypothetical protein